LVLTIAVTTGAGEADTTLAAFDAALLEAGIGNFNLVPLSSVIPTGALVVEKHPDFDEEAVWGHRLYLVLAEQRADDPGAEAWAGIGWMQDPESGRGLFVEHEGTSEEQVVSDIERSLANMRATRPQSFGPVEMVVRGTRCTSRPVAALVAAVYRDQPW
jgi:arginine decarboxylase